MGPDSQAPSPPQPDSHPGPENKKARSLKGAWLFNLALIAVFGLSTAIPVELKLLPAAVEHRLPLAIGDWIGKMDLDHTKERQILAPDTKLFKADYRDAAGRLLQVSLVISGQDLNNSIHRPERCLAAQGHGAITRERFTLDLSGGGKLPVSHVTSLKRFQGDDGESFTVAYKTYYWFIGHETVTNSHYERSFIDIFDRLTGGTAQQWAYVSVMRPSPRTPRTRKRTNASSFHSSKPSPEGSAP